MLMTHIRTPLNKYTFISPKIREWVESRCKGKVLNLFAGTVLLNTDEIRNDVREEMDAHYHKDALDFVTEWDGSLFDTVVLDPPYSYRKSMEMYNGAKASRFNQVKDGLPRIMQPDGKVITFGYQSVSMGKTRGFELAEVCVFSHGGAIHDTIASVEERIVV